MADLLPRNAWGGTVDPVGMAAKLATKFPDVSERSARAALEETSSIRGKCRIYKEGYAVELLQKVQEIDPDASDVHLLLAEGYEDVDMVRQALALSGRDVEKARAILDRKTDRN